jgi:hypothetical protein
MSTGSALAVWGWRRLATWATLLGRDGSALAWRERIAAARPEDAQALASLAHMKASRGAQPEAIVLLERAAAHVSLTESLTLSLSLCLCLSVSLSLTQSQ